MNDFKEKMESISINDAIDEINYDIDKAFSDKRYDEAISYAKSLIESTCHFIYNAVNGQDETGSLNKLINDTLTSLNFENDNTYFQKLKSILNEMGCIRNNRMISHGKRRSVSKITKEECWLCCIISKNFSTYLLKNYCSNFIKPNRLLGRIEPRDREWVNEQINGYKVQVRECAGFVDRADFTTESVNNIKDVINSSDIEKTINYLLPNDAKWENRKNITDNKFKVYSCMYDRSFDIVFEKYNDGKYGIYLDSISTKDISEIISLTEPVDKRVEEVKKIYKLNQYISDERQDLNNVLYDYNFENIRKVAKKLINDVIYEIINKNNFSNIKGSLIDKVQKVYILLSTSLNGNNLGNILRNLTDFIVSPKLNPKYKDEYLLYVSMVDDLCMFLIEIDKAKQLYQQNVLEDRLGGRFNKDENSVFSEISTNNYKSTNPVLDISLEVKNEIIEKVGFKFKTLLTIENEFVTDQIRDYLPEDVEKDDVEIENGIIFYSPSLNRKYIEIYEIKNDGLYIYLEEAHEDKRRKKINSKTV